MLSWLLGERMGVGGREGAVLPARPQGRTLARMEGCSGTQSQLRAPGAFLRHGLGFYWE